jgi:hypothetical protein
VRIDISRWAQEQQVRDIGAGDAEQQENAALQEIEDRPRSADDFIIIRPHERTEPAGLHELLELRETVEHGRQQLRRLPLGHFRSGTGAQPRCHRGEFAAAAVVGFVRRGEDERLVERDFADRGQRARRGDADDLVRTPVQADGASDERRIAAVARLPQFVADDDPRVRAFLHIVVVERPPARDLDPEQGEQRRRRANRPQPLGRRAFVRQVEVLEMIKRALLERLHALAAIDVVGHGQRRLLQPELRVRVPDQHQPVTVGIGQFLEEHGVDQGEHRRVRANRDRHRADGDEGEQR